MRLNSLLTLSTIVLTLSGCGGGGGGTTITNPTTSDVNVTINGIVDYQVESLGTANTINAKVSLGTLTRDLYLVLSNSATTSAISTITHNPNVIAAPQAKTVFSTDVKEKPRILHHPQYVEEFNAQIGTLLTKPDENQFQAKTISIPEKLEDIVNTEQIFYLSKDTSQSTLATARYVSPIINTAYGDKRLNIWVSNDSFDKEDGSKDCIKSKCVTQDMVNALADTFLKDGLDNDIYDWVTNIYQEEWGSNLESYFIPQNDEITILLTDIPNSSPPVYDTPEGGIIGFFFAKDNYVKGIYNNGADDLRGSNERIMFYADAVMFANEDDLSWDINDSWPKEMISTLAHEFQHMIHFYQKTVLRTNNNTDTWINEMLSESTEDIIATKIEHKVDGRYPLFNKYNFFSLTNWYEAKDNSYEEFEKVLANYSRANAFGAYLLRNYGGAQVLHDIMHNNFDDKQAVVYAVNQPPNVPGKTFANLLNEWGVAVILSDHDNLVDTPVYNIGALFENVYGTENIIYEMNSINFFNYNPLPTIYTTSGIIQPEGNYYYKIGDNVTGDINITLELNGQTEATLIAK